MLPVVGLPPAGVHKSLIYYPLISFCCCVLLSSKKPHMLQHELHELLPVTMTGNASVWPFGRNIPISAVRYAGVIGIFSSRITAVCYWPVLSQVSSDSQCTHTTPHGRSAERSGRPLWTASARGTPDSPESPLSSPPLCTPGRLPAGRAVSGAGRGVRGIPGRLSGGSPQGLRRVPTLRGPPRSGGCDQGILGYSCDLCASVGFDLTPTADSGSSTRDVTRVRCDVTAGGALRPVGCSGVQCDG